VYVHVCVPSVPSPHGGEDAMTELSPTIAAAAIATSERPQIPVARRSRRGAPSPARLPPLDAVGPDLCMVIPYLLYLPEQMNCWSCLDTSLSTCRRW
jgi:hypothetical protein